MPSEPLEAPPSQQAGAGTLTPEAIEWALRNNDELLRATLEATSDGLLVTRVGGFVLYANARFAEMLGLEHERLQGMKVEDLLRDLTSRLENPEVLGAAITGLPADGPADMGILRGRNGRVFQVGVQTLPRAAGGARRVFSVTEVTALATSEELLRATLDSTADGILVTKVGGTVLYANAQFSQMVQIEPERLGVMTVQELFQDLATRIENADTVREQLQSLPEFGPAHLGPIRRFDGRVFDITIQTLIPKPKGARRVFSVTDVTEEVRAADNARQSAELMRVLLNAPHAGAILIERDGTIAALNDYAAARLAQNAAEQGLSFDEFVGRNVYDMFSPDVRARRRAANDEVLLTGVRKQYLDERDGVWTDVTIDPIFDLAGNISRLAIFSRDITERKRDEQALLRRSRELEALNEYLERTTTELEQSREELRETGEQLAILLHAETERSRTDPLTGALNHGSIREVLHEAIAADVTFAIAMVDLDGMKAINDTYGHQTGDRVLLRTVEALDRRGAIVGRYGGDEFMVALLDADPEDVQAYKAEVEAALRDAQVIDPETGASVDVVASVGLSWFPRDATTLTALVEAADERMYSEKANRRSESGLSSSRMFADERTARLAGELLHLMTQPAPLDERLRLVSHRLSIAGSFAAVSFDVLDGARDDAEIVGQNTFSRAPDELVEAWNKHQRSNDGHPINALLDETRRPVVIDDVQVSPFVTDEQKRLLQAVGIRSGLVVPLYAGDARVGTMSAGRKELAAFSASDERFLEVIGGELARLIDLVLKAQAHDDRRASAGQASKAA